METIPLEDLTLTTVPQLWARRRQLFIADAVDLDACNAVDSAGIALLVRWSKQLTPQRLQLRHAPPKLLSLLRTYRVTELFAADPLTPDPAGSAP